MKQVDMRREHRLRERTFREREGAFESSVSWYRWSELASQMDDVYDEGDARYHPAAKVPLLWWFDESGSERGSAEGRSLYRTMSFAVTIGSLRNAGIEPEPDDRLNDLILFRSWWWDVTSFESTSQSSLAVSHSTFRPGDDSTARIMAQRRFPLSDRPLALFPPITGLAYHDPSVDPQ